MTLGSIITRTATITLAAAALAAPTASARPADTPPAITKAAAPGHKQAGRSASAGTQSKQDPVADIHAPLARVAAVQPATRRRLPGPPTWPVNPQPIAPAHAVNNPASSAVNPTTMGLGIVASLLAIAGVAGLARRSRRVQRARVIA